MLILSCFHSLLLTTHAKPIFCWFSPQSVSLSLFFFLHNFEELLNVQSTGAESGFADLSESIYGNWQFCHLVILLEESTACQLVIVFAG